MRLHIRLILIFILTFWLPFNVTASDIKHSAIGYPSINPQMVTIDSLGMEVVVTEYSGSAPFTATFNANATDTDGWNAYYEWRIMKENDPAPFLIRYEENTTVTFNVAGVYSIYLYAVFTQGNDTVAYTEDYWEKENPLRITISESKLEMPNAFSPNGDQINDIYRPKQNACQSIVEFHAYIFNRWGQKVYEWTDPNGGWDGKIDGKDAKQGVYYVLVKAKGADGRVYNIRKDVNLLRGYTETDH